METCKVAYEQYRDTLGETDSATIAAKQNLERYQQEYEEATAEVTKLEGQVRVRTFPTEGYAKGYAVLEKVRTLTDESFTSTTGG